MPSVSSSFSVGASDNNYKSTTLIIISVNKCRTCFTSMKRHISQDCILQVAMKPYCSTVRLIWMQSMDKNHSVQQTLNSQWLLMLEELCICKYRVIILKCSESSKETKEPDWENGRRSRRRDSICSSNSYSAKSLVMITHRRTVRVRCSHQ